jgi:hypothetical protein
MYVAAALVPQCHLILSNCFQGGWGGDLASNTVLSVHACRAGILGQSLGAIGTE